MCKQRCSPRLHHPDVVVSYIMMIARARSLDIDSEIDLLSLSLLLLQVVQKLLLPYLLRLAACNILLSITDSPSYISAICTALLSVLFYKRYEKEKAKILGSVLDDGSMSKFDT